MKYTNEVWQMNRSKLDDSIDVIKTFDDAVVLMNNASISFMGYAADLSSVAIVTIDDKKVAKTEVMAGIDIEKFAITKHMAKEVSLVHKDGGILLEDSKTTFKVPLKELHKDIIEIATGYLKFAPSASIKELLEKIIARRDEGKLSAVVIDVFEVDPDDVKKVAALAKTFRESKLVISGDGSNVILSASDASVNTSMECKLAKSTKQFQQSFPSIGFETMSKIGKFQIGLFENTEDNDSPAVVFYLGDGYRVMMILAPYIEEENNKSKDKKKKEEKDVDE